MQVVGFLTVFMVAVVAALHIVFFILESFCWTTPLGKRVFGLTPELAEGSKALAMNQGLYNAFLAAGLIWGLVLKGECAFGIKVFFLSCVVIAGIVGGLTAKRSILVVQGLPGLIAFLLVVFAGH